MGLESRDMHYLRWPSAASSVAESNGVTDLYQDYFGPSVLGGLADGIRGYPLLGPQPFSINLELNDWFRLPERDRGG